MARTISRTYRGCPVRGSAESPAHVLAELVGDRDAAEVVGLRHHPLAQPIAQKQREEQAQVIRTLAQQIAQVPGVARKVQLLEAEVELAQIGAAPIADGGRAITALAQRLCQRPDLQAGLRVHEVVANGMGVRPGAGGMDSRLGAVRPQGT
jgi:hypothetical protein